ncbi:S9 family peptidase [Nostocoides sp. HKS02]|uniref:alpha/beta hydrolase family protein n=1 Tax=Nostocoides sp. HKS02 TaxID=1813880 RepID=UPI0018A84AB8|nr:alpha/beta hydrolase [Tetrasphaera sp. HKS02]
MGAARLLWPTEVEDPRAIVLILHGGKARSQQAVRPWQAAVWRMAPFARSVTQAGSGAVGVASLRYAVRGWNAAAASPVGDAELAIEQIAARYPGVPIGLLGHSMGGRVALHLGGDERVRAIAALAPWVEGRDPARWHPGLHVLVMHGTRDRMTSPKQSRAMAELMTSQGADVTYVSVQGEGHAMLRQADRWHEESAAFLVRHLLTPG